MGQDLFYEMSLTQFRLLKEKSGRYSRITLKSSSKIKLHGIIAYPKTLTKNIPVALLLHGYSSNYRRIAYIANSLIDKGVAVILMNLRGHGNSSGEQNDIEGMQRDLTTMMKYIISHEEFDHKRILLLGVSLGSLIALTAGYRHPNISHIISMAGISSPTDLLDGMTRFRQWRWKLIRVLGGLNIQSMIGKSQFIPKYHPNLYPSSKQILLLHCKNDSLVSENNFWENVVAFKLNNEHYALFPRGMHSFLFVKRNVVQEIRDWLIRTGFYKAE